VIHCYQAALADFTDKFQFIFYLFIAFIDTNEHLLPTFCIRPFLSQVCPHIQSCYFQIRYY